MGYAPISFFLFFLHTTHFYHLRTSDLLCAPFHIIIIFPLLAPAMQMLTVAPLCFWVV